MMYLNGKGYSYWGRYTDSGPGTDTRPSCTFDAHIGTTLKISIRIDSDAGESLSCCKGATGPDFLLA